MKIACVLGPGFEDSEFKEPFDAFKKEGNEVVIISTDAGKELIGDKGKVTTKSDKSIKDVTPEEFDALLIPGGYSPDKLRAQIEFCQFVQHFADNDKPIFAICHGPQLLLTADRYKGKKMTAWKTVQGDLQKAGGTVVDEEVVVDGNLVTSRQPQDLPAFIGKSIELLKKSQQQAA